MYEGTTIMVRNVCSMRQDQELMHFDNRVNRWNHHFKDLWCTSAFWCGGLTRLVHCECSPKVMGYCENSLGTLSNHQEHATSMYSLQVDISTEIWYALWKKDSGYCKVSCSLSYDLFWSATQWAIYFLDRDCHKSPIAQTDGGDIKQTIAGQQIISLFSHLTFSNCFWQCFGKYHGYICQGSTVWTEVLPKMKLFHYKNIAWKNFQSAEFEMN